MKKIVTYLIIFLLGEASYFGMDLWRNYANLRWVEPVKAAQRQAAEDRGIQEYKANKIHAGRPISAEKYLTYYAVDSQHSASDFDGTLIASEVADILGKVDWNTLKSPPLGLLGSGTPFTPFFVGNPPREIATADAPGKGRCVIAGLNGRIIFIPLDDYKAAGLPVR